MRLDKIVVTGHQSRICDVLVCGTAVVTASNDGTCKVWDAEGGWECVATIEAHTDAVTSMAWMDGKLVSAGWRSIKVFVRRERDCWECSHILDSHACMHLGWVSAVERLDAVPETLLLSAGEKDRTIRVWKVGDDTVDCMRVVQTGHTGAVNTLATSVDLVFSGGGPADGDVRVWDANTWQCLAVLRAHAGLVSCLLTCFDNVLVTAGFDGDVKMWDTQTMQQVRTLKGHRDAVTTVVVAPGRSATLLTSGADRSIRSWTGSDWECDCVVENCHTSVIRKLVHLEDGTLVSGSWDLSLRSWRS